MHFCRSKELLTPMGTNYRSGENIGSCTLKLGRTFLVSPVLSGTLAPVFSGFDQFTLNKNAAFQIENMKYDIAKISY